MRLRYVLAAPAYGMRRAVEKMLTVRDMVEVTGVRVVAGAGGLDRPVRWVHISELNDPTPWLNGGELLLTTGMTVNGDGGGYIARIAATGWPGSASASRSAASTRSPREMPATADALDFPILEVPYETPFIALTEKAFTHIAAEQADMLQRAVDAHERLEQVALDEGGLDGLVAALGELIGGSAAVVDARGHTLAGEPAGRRPRAARSPATRRAPVCRSRRAPLTELDRLIVHQAVTIVALELLRRRVQADTERRLAGDVLASVLSGELEGEELVRRLEPFGLGDRITVLVARGRRPSARWRPRSDGAVARAGTLVVRAHPRRATARPSRWRRPRAPARGVAAGASRPVPLADVRRGFHEARWALECAALTATTPAPVHLPRPRLLPAAAGDAGRRRAAHVLRLHPRPARERGQRLRAPSCCARSRSSSSATASGSAPRASCPATVTPCATGSSASSSSPAARWTPRATASTSGSPCAGANSSN